MISNRGGGGKYKHLGTKQVTAPPTRYSCTEMARMNRSLTKPSVIFLLGIAVMLCVVSSKPLDDYVKAPDDHYNYTFLTQIKRDNYTLHVLNMTSQKWMDSSFTNHPIWWHYVIIIVPTHVQANDTALLLIDGGENTHKIPDEHDIWVSVMALMAVSTRTVTVCVKQIPNQPVVFMSDPSHKRRKEDAILAWSWREYILNPKHPQGLVQMAMTKAVVRTMDTVDSYSKKTRRQKIDNFFILGASKRGWTTWLTSAVDSRIIGMAPIVFDLLNMDTALHHHYRSLGGWTFAFHNYYDANITNLLDSPGYFKSQEIIDPIVYKDRYKMPTYIVKAAGDEFFLLDETMFFYNNLTGPHHLRVIPNCEHSMINQIPNLFLGLRSFYLSIIHGATYPKVTWKMTSSNSSGKIHVKMNKEPLSVLVYHADTLPDGRRDFRLITKDPKTGDEMYHPVLWSKGQATRLTSTEYEASFNKPVEGWVAFFIEVTFEGVEDSVLAFSTEVNVVPNTLPFPDCTTNCTGRLV